MFTNDRCGRDETDCHSFCSRVALLLLEIYKATFPILSLVLFKSFESAVVSTRIRVLVRSQHPFNEVLMASDLDKREFGECLDNITNLAYRDLLKSNNLNCHPVSQEPPKGVGLESEGKRVKRRRHSAFLSRESPAFSSLSIPLHCHEDTEPRENPLPPRRRHSVVGIVRPPPPLETEGEKPPTVEEETPLGQGGSSTGGPKLVLEEAKKDFSGEELHSGIQCEASVGKKGEELHSEAWPDWEDLCETSNRKGGVWGDFISQAATGLRCAQIFTPHVSKWGINHIAFSDGVASNGYDDIFIHFEGFSS